jgi:major membrane immunogen (membrane-anchored lipoprotein)
MRNCIICKKETQGSIGAAGIKWACICQPCKDETDKDALQIAVYIGKVVRGVYELCNDKGQE